MDIRTPFRYLIGDRTAILELAASRPALWVGLLFVFSAGFAREYDGEDLWHEPWHLFLPLAASLLSSFILFAVAFGPLMLRDPKRPTFFEGYRAFLTLFWMTAPLAWLYAIPYERFLQPVRAVQANLATLGLVALWRVALMVRVVSVLMGYRVVSAFFLVMAFADAVAVAAITLMPRPIFDIMGGIRLSAGEQIVLDVTCTVLVLGVLTSVIWGLGALVSFLGSRPTWQGQKNSSSASRPSWGLCTLAGLSVVVWAVVLPWTQAEQLLRHNVESDLRAGRIAEALAVMSAHAPKDFPPQWDPPPRIGYGESTPRLLAVMEVIVSEPQAPWVHAVYVEKFRRYLASGYERFGRKGKEGDAFIRVLERLPEGRSLAAQSWDADLKKEMLGEDDNEPPD